MNCQIVRAVCLGSLLLVQTTSLASPRICSWRCGDAYVYSVRIEAGEPTYVDALQGSVTYTLIPQGNAVVIIQRGTVASQQQDRNGAPLAQPMPSRLEHLGFGRVDTNPSRVGIYGLLHPTVGGALPPFIPGSLTRMTFDPLPRDGKDIWTVEDDCAIYVQPGSPAGAPVALPAHERMTYVAGTVADGEVPVARHYELKTDELIGGVPRIQMLGDGPVALDASTGMPHHASLKAVLTSTWVGGSDKITITIDTRLIQATPAAGAPPLPGAQDASDTQPSEGGPTVQQADTGPMPGHALPQPRGGQVCTDDEVKTFLAGLKSNQPNERIEAANALARSSADDDHAGGVARALVAALDNRDVGTREACVQALGVWATSETIPALIGALGDTDFSVRWMALDTLAPLKDPRSIGPIASRLEDGADRAKASAALLKFGAPAAEAVAKQLKSTDWETRMEACHLLKSIGNKAQIPLIEDLAANDPNGLVKLAASDALLTLNVNNVDE